ncbi:MAG: hypothetical protein SFV54_15725 [Bryobacteraceae bacterium]|nr:hypothetical protein [Bryobacteraceae bacterium]
MPATTVTFLAILLLTMIAIAGAVAGVLGSGGVRRLGAILPFSGGLLVGIALFWMIPEISSEWKWPLAAAFSLAGFLLLWFVNRHLYPVCPSCSHTHDHDHCSTRLHGFGGPLVVAATLHSFFDGWGAAASSEGSMELGRAFMLGALVHKVPEGLAYGAILRASFSRKSTALVWAVLIEGVTLAGGAAALAAGPLMTPVVLRVILSLVAGTFLFLGYHAIHNEWRRNGRPSVVPALTGAAGAAALQQGLRVLLR